MNCKPGDLAVVVSGYASRLGAVVQCRSTTPTVSGEALWLIDRILSHDDGGGSNLEFDKNLRPLHDSDGEDETLTWAGLPNKQEQPA